MQALQSSNSALEPRQTIEYEAARENKRENNGTRDSCDAAFPRKVQGPYRLTKIIFVILGGAISYFVNTFSLPRQVI